MQNGRATSLFGQPVGAVYDNVLAGRDNARQVMEIMMKFAALAAGALASALCLSPAAARSGPVEQVTRHVAYADLDLATDSGRSRLDRRIATVVTEACGSASGLDLSGQNAARRCRIAAKQAAAAQRDLALAAARDAAATRLALAAKP